MESEESERFHSLLTPLTTPSFTIQWKPHFRSRKQKRKNKPITIHVPTLCDWFSSPPSACDSDHKRRSRKRNHNDVFSRTLILTLLITNPTPTPSLVETGLNKYQISNPSVNRCGKPLMISSQYPVMWPSFILFLCARGTASLTGWGLDSKCSNTKILRT